MASSTVAHEVDGKVITSGGDSFKALVALARDVPSNDVWVRGEAFMHDNGVGVWTVTVAGVRGRTARGHVRKDLFHGQNLELVCITAAAFMLDVNRAVAHQRLKDAR